MIGRTRDKRVRAVFFIAIMTLLIGCGIVNVVSAQEVYTGRVSNLDGKVFFQSGRSLDWVEGYLNSPVQEGDRIWSDVGSLGELHLVGSILVRFDADSKFDIIRMNEGGTVIKLWLGSFYLRVVDDVSRERTVGIETPDGRGAVLSKGLYRVDVTQDYKSIFRNYDGALSMTSMNTGETTLRGGESYIIQKDVSVNRIETFSSSAPKDRLDQYNASRDEVLIKPESSSHVSPNITIGVYDLDYYGVWIYDPAYGYCWQPRVSGGWVPYRYGRWVWVHPWGWTWVSYEPWGWAPYHYGYWYYSSYHGWMWRPDRYYGPHWVVWTAHSSSVGWLPMHPADATNVHWSASTNHWTASVSNPHNASIPGGIHASTSLTKEEFQQGKLIKSDKDIRQPSQEESRDQRWEAAPAKDLKPERSSTSRMPPRTASPRVTTGPSETYTTPRDNQSGRQEKQPRQIIERTEPTPQRSGSQSSDYDRHPERTPELIQPTRPEPTRVVPTPRPRPTEKPQPTAKPKPTPKPKPGKSKGKNTQDDDSEEGKTKTRG